MRILRLRRFAVKSKKVAGNNQTLYNVLMQKRRNFFSVFILCILAGLIIFFLFRTNSSNFIRGAGEWVLIPIQETVYRVAKQLPGNTNKEVKKLQEENIRLQTQLKNQQTTEREMRALRDQYQTTTTTQLNLLPSHIIGIKGYIPGVASATEITLDKGEKDGVRVGHAVIYKDIIIGKAIKTTKFLSAIQLVTNRDMSFTAKTMKTNALGIVKGSNSDIVSFTNVILSEKLATGDIVVTKGDVDTQGIGLPPDLIVGKIVSVDRKPSSLFQSAEIERPLFAESLTMVFVIMGMK